MVIFARQLPLENDIQPSFPFDPSATGTMAIIARSVDDTSVSATAALELVRSERSIATANRKLFKESSQNEKTPVSQAFSLEKPGFSLMRAEGLEPSTQGLKVLCSTD
jgi:hypothetical protein